MLGSNGAAGRFDNINVTSLSKGRYKLYAGIGKTASSSVGDISFTFKLNDDIINEYVAPSFPNLFDISSPEFDVTDDESVLKVSLSNNGEKDWIDYIYVQKVDAITVAKNAAGYATFSSPYALDFTTSAIKAYTANVEDNQVVMTRQYAVPESTGLFLQFDMDNTDDVYIPLATSVPDAISNNALIAHLTDGNVAAGNYVFSGAADGGQLAFRKLTTDTFVPAGRSYLSVPQNSSARLFFKLDDESTGIILNDNNRHKKELPLYNLMGIKYPHATKGIFIKNGKKIVTSH